jgi:hypothetical protein
MLAIVAADHEKDIVLLAFTVAAGVGAGEAEASRQHRDGGDSLVGVLTIVVPGIGAGWRHGLGGIDRRGC